MSYDGFDPLISTSNNFVESSFDCATNAYDPKVISGALDEYMDDPIGFLSNINMLGPTILGAFVCAMALMAYVSFISKITRDRDRALDRLR